MGDFGNLPLNCPPPEATVTSNEIMYRFVADNPPKKSDFISWRNENLSTKCPEGITECQACSLSVYAKQEDAIRVKKRIPRFKKSNIAQGKLSSASGVIQNTPSRASQSHHSWWMHIDQEPWNYFQVV